MNWLDKIPYWLRWILFIPVAVLAAVLSYPIIVLLNVLLSPFGNNILSKYIVILIGSVFKGFVFVWTGAVFAPRNQFVISIILMIIVGILIGILILSKIFYSDIMNRPWLEALSAYLSVMVGAIFACYQFRKPSM